MIFSLIPLPYKIAGAGLLALAAYGAWEWRWSAGFGAGVKHQQGEQNRIDLKRSEVAIETMTERRAKDAETARLIQEATDAKDKAEAQRRADKLIADAASGDLRRRFEQRLRELVQAVHATATAGGAGSGNSSPATSSPSADDPAGVLANVYGRCIQQRQRYAEIADERGQAGALCQAAYDALTQPP